jgi:predicted small metal-binding protein
MTKILTCRDVGVECDFVAQGETVEEVLEKTREHARKDHGYADIPPELMDKVKASIRDKETEAA